MCGEWCIWCLVYLVFGVFGVCHGPVRFSKSIYTMSGWFHHKLSSLASIASSIFSSKSHPNKTTLSTQPLAANRTQPQSSSSLSSTEIATPPTPIRTSRRSNILQEVRNGRQFRSAGALEPIQMEEMKAELRTLRGKS